MQAISYRQSVFLLSMILPVTGHMLLLPSMFSLSSNDAWISILLTFPLSLVYIWIIYRLHSLSPDKTFVKMIEMAYGKYLGKLISILILGYFVYMLVISLYALFDFIQVIFLPETSNLVLAVLFYLGVLYGVKTGIESVTRVSESLFIFIIFTGVLIGLVTIPDKNYELLLPIFENGFKPVLQGMWITIALYGEMVILLMLTLRKESDQSRSLFFTSFIFSILILIMFLGTTVSSLTIFGEEMAKTLEYPAQNIVRMVSFGFIERFDIYGIFVMVTGSLIRMATLQIIFVRGLKQWLNISQTWWLHGFTALSILLLTYIGVKNHQQFVDFYLTVLYRWMGLISVGLPVLTWIVLEMKRIIAIKNYR